MQHATAWHLWFAAAAALTACCCSAGTLPASRQALFAPPDLLDVTISPDGRHIAYLAPDGERTSLWIAPAASPGAGHALIAEPGRSVFAYAWSARGDRLIYQTGRQPAFATDNRGGDDYVIYSLDPTNGAALALSGRLDRRVKFISSAQRPREIFVSPSPVAAGERQAMLVDIHTGKARYFAADLSLAPVYPDDRLEPRLGTRAGQLGGLELFGRAARGAWRPLAPLSFAGRLFFEVHGFDSRGVTAYLTLASEHDTGALVAMDASSGLQALIAHRDGETITNVLLHPRTRKPIAYKSARLRASWTTLDRAYDKDFERLRAFAAALAPAGSDLSIASRDARDRSWIVVYEADVLPKRYYLYDRETQALRLLFSESREREQLRFFPMRPVTIRARDGLELPSYLTLPHADAAGGARPAQPLPLVLWVHGGPQSQETWHFDPQSQWLASRGYAVLSVNFRGSRGFGKHFVEAAYGQWGRAMQDDLIDSVRWAVEQRIAAPDRVAIMGLSYGGFATLSAMAGAPDLFACGVETVGLADLNLFLGGESARPTPTDPRARAEFESRAARDRMQIGGDPRTEAGRAALLARSPVAHADKFRAPVLITHGLLDNGVVPAHSERMVEALDKRGKPVVYLTYPDEGHGLAYTANKISHAAITELFLSRCLGGTPPAFGPEDFADSSVQVRAGLALLPGLSEALAESKAREQR